MKLVHIIKKGETRTLCRTKLENTLKYKWIHPIEAYKKKLIIYNKLDMPTCPYCNKILELHKIDIVKEYID